MDWRGLVIQYLNLVIWILTMVPSVFLFTLLVLASNGMGRGSRRGR